MLIDHLMCRDGKLEESLLEAKSCQNPRSTTDLSNRALDVPQVCEGALVEDVEIYCSPRTPTIAFSREFSITKVRSFLLP